MIRRNPKPVFSLLGGTSSILRTSKKTTLYHCHFIKDYIVWKEGSCFSRSCVFVFVFLLVGSCPCQSDKMLVRSQVSGINLYFSAVVDCYIVGSGLWTNAMQWAHIVNYLALLKNMFSNANCEKKCHRNTKMFQISTDTY